MYKRSPFYQNVHAKNNRKEYIEPSKDFLELIELLEEQEDIFEVGFNLGERLYILKSRDLDVVGGVEFDPFFGTYGNKHFAIYQNFYQIILTSVADWFDAKHKTYYTFKLLSDFDEETERNAIVQKIQKLADENGSKVFFVENQNIPNTERIGVVQVYVGTNGSKVDDRAADSEEKQPEPDNTVKS